MNFGSLMNTAMQFVHTHHYIAIVSFVVLALLVYFRRKATLKLVAITLAIGIVFYFLSLIGKATDSGISQKNKLTNKSIHSTY